MSSKAKAKRAHADDALPLPTRWVVLEYQPVAPFALRTSLATSSGGKTLLVPTPYAIKLALVDATIRASGVGTGERLFEAVRACPVAITPSQWTCVTNTFGRVLRLHEEKGKKKDGGAELAVDDDVEGGDEDDGRPPAGVGREPLVTGDVACLLDDTGPLAEFDRINTFSDADARIGVERVVRHHLLPVRRIASTRAFTIYRRVDVAP